MKNLKNETESIASMNSYILTDVRKQKGNEMKQDKISQERRKPN